MRKETIKQSRFTIVELLVVITIIAILAGALIVNIGGPSDKAGQASTRADIMMIDLAMEEYKKSHGDYPFIDKNTAINLSDHADSDVKLGIIALLKLETFGVNENGVPQDYWEHPIYLIHAKNYDSSPLAASIPNLGEKVFYNPRTFQLVAGGPDGTVDSLGSAEDNVANYPKK